MGRLERWRHRSTPKPGQTEPAPSPPWCTPSFVCARPDTTRPEPRQVPRPGPSRSRMSATSVTSWVSTQRTTSAIVRRSRAAASSRGARNLAAVAYQNSPSARRPVRPSRLAEIGGHPTGLAPVGASRQGRPRARWIASALRGVDAPHLTSVRPRAFRVPQEISLDARCQNGAGPIQNGRNGQTARLAALGGADDHDRLRRFGRQGCGGEPARQSSEREAPGGGSVGWNHQGPEVATTGPAGAAAPLRSPPGGGRPDGKDTPATRAPPRPAASTMDSRSHSGRPIMAASVSAIRRSTALKRC